MNLQLRPSIQLLLRDQFISLNETHQLMASVVRLLCEIYDEISRVPLQINNKVIKVLCYRCLISALDFIRIVSVADLKCEIQILIGV